MASVLEQIRQLEEQKQQLLETARKEALATAEAAIRTLSELGFNYRLTQTGAPARTGGRRSGIRQDVLNTIKSNGTMTRAQLLDHFNARGDKKLEQSLSNALSALKRKGSITAEDGNYKST